VSQAAPNQIAPEGLEKVRELLNTWWIPNDTRDPRDDLNQWLADNGLTDESLGSLQLLRDELRQVVEHAAQLDSMGNRWIDRYGITPVVTNHRVRFHGDDSTAGSLAVAVLEAIRDGSIDRLKACPDCRWVFYDNTRNGRKRWCMMNASGPDARGCGNIAKSRRHRARMRQALESANAETASSAQH
jgi:hypothetical protein